MGTTIDSIIAGVSMKVAYPFDMGAGHINPSRALDPGLIYDIKPIDYTIFLCKLGFTKQHISKTINLASQEASCNHLLAITTTNDIINYPSITLSNLNSSQ
jgi:hypothetical protein